MIYDESEYQKMLAIERKLWWYRMLYHKISRALYGTSKEAAIVDIGCGTGGVLQYLKELGYNNVSGIDKSPIGARIAAKRGLTIEQVDVFEYLRKQADHSVDVFLFIDSLTYVTPDLHVSLFQECKRVLKVRGKIILNSAAIEAFRGTHDEHVETLCRLTKADYESYSLRAGFDIVRMEYWPFALGVPIFVIRFVQKLSNRLVRNKKHSTDLALSPPWLDSFFFTICRAEEKVSFLAFFGSSLFAVFQSDTRPAKQG